MNTQPSTFQAVEPTLDQIWIDAPAATLVAEFNRACDHELRNQPMVKDDIGTDNEKMLFSLIDEEFKELEQARKDRDLLGIIDALQDLKYVIYGYELRLGISSEEHFAEVHYRNMDKVGPDGKVTRRPDGKILKPEGWEGPDHQAIIDKINEQGGVIYG